MSTSPRPIAPLPRLRRFEPQDVRRRQLIEATIDTIAEVGFVAAAIHEIARRAGVSTGLVAFYFGDKDGLLEATLRHLAGQLRQALVLQLATAANPRGRIAAVVDAMLSDSQFERRIASVWLAFWGQVPAVPRFARIQRAYAGRLQANLVAGFASLVRKPDAERLATATAALIDGLWLRSALSRQNPDSEAARQMVMAFVDGQLALLHLAGLNAVPTAYAPRKVP